MRPSPDTECPGVGMVQRRLLDVVEVASSGDCPLGDALILGVEGDALKA